MTKRLLKIRMQSLLAALTAQARRKNKSGKGMIVVYIALYLYVFVVMSGMMAVNFYTLAQPYHQMGLDWLYFALAGLMALGFSVIGSAFATQSQLYDAKDNALLLSMPIPPQSILMSRMIPLLLMNLLFASTVMLPAIVVYGIFVQFRPLWILLQLFGLVAIVLLAQAIACLVGWVLHRMLRKLNKSAASILFLVLFLALYFLILSRAQDLLNALIYSSATIADTLINWVWPLYAMGTGSIGSFLHAVVLPLIGVAAFGTIYWFLSVTFIKSATQSHAAGKKRSLALDRTKQSSQAEAIVRKELKKFLGTPIYLTNMGLGILMVSVMAVAGIIFRNDVFAILSVIPGYEDMLPLLICALIAFNISTMCISTPSVSLEGKNIWILKALPLSAKDILLGKLRFHIRMTVPISSIAGGILSAVYGCGILYTTLCILIPGLLALLNGIVGLVAGLKWARLDFISEAYPCKQSVSVVVTMFGIMGLSALLGVGTMLLTEFLPLPLLLGIDALFLGVLCWVFYRLLVTWGAAKWNSL